MDFRCLPILFSLNLILMTAYAALPPQIYWERMLPVTPMPKSISELLNRGGFFSTEHIGKVTNDDQKAHIVEWGKSLDNQLEDEFPATLYLLKKDLSQKEKTSIKKNEMDDAHAFIPKMSRLDVDDVSIAYQKAHHQLHNNDANAFIPKMSRVDEDDVTIAYQKAHHQLHNNANAFIPKMNRVEVDDLSIAYQKARNQLHNNDANAFIPKMSRVDEDDVSIAYQKAHHQLHNNANGLIPEHPKGNFFFMEEGLRPGSKLYVHFNKREHTTRLLPRQVAQRIPFTSEKTNEILDLLSVEPESKIAQDIRKALWYCELPVYNGEEKHCATSLESMLDFIISMLGNNVRAMSTEVERETKSIKFTVKQGAKKLADESLIVCHPLKYPHMVFYCHHILNTTAHLVPLEGEDGTRVKALAVCHRDTSQWDPNFVAFQLLKLKPGDAPVCHFLPEDHLTFAK